MVKMLRLTFFYILILGFVIVLVPTTAQACSCAELPSVADGFERSEAVFSGKVLQVKERKGLRGITSKHIIFEVDSIWKGITESQVLVVTGIGGGDCGIDFEVGERYVVYASQSTMYGGTDHLVTHICQRTNSLKLAKEDLAWLGEGDKPIKQVDLLNNTNGLVTYLWASSIVVIGIILFLIWLRKMGRNKKGNVE